MSAVSRLLTCASTAAIISFTAPALGHIWINPDTAVEASQFTAVFVVPHGCDGAPTIAIRIKIPVGVSAVKPQMKPGWAVALKTRKLDAPVKSDHGQNISETVDEVEWRGGPLPDNLYDTFGLMMKLPKGAGRRLYFPTVQESDHDACHWIEIPAEGQGRDELREPAPAVTLVPKRP